MSKNYRVICGHYHILVISKRKENVMGKMLDYIPKCFFVFFPREFYLPLCQTVVEVISFVNLLLLIHHCI